MEILDKIGLGFKAGLCLGWSLFGVIGALGEESLYTLAMYSFGVFVGLYALALHLKTQTTDKQGV